AISECELLIHPNVLNVFVPGIVSCWGLVHMFPNVRFLKNAWYVAALSTELTEEDLFSRKLLNETVLFYRRKNGEPVALKDRCPHRFAPLSMGKREGDQIRCQYHGLAFDETGTCTDNPHGNGRIPKACKVRQYPVHERDGFIWIWMGDPQQADIAKVRNLSLYSENPSTAVGHAYMHNECPYDLIVDNVMDLSHVDHLHGPLINTAGKLSPQIPQVRELDDNRVSIGWSWEADSAMLLFQEHLPRPQGKADQYIEVIWQAPANMTLTVGAVQDSDDYHRDGVVLYDFHAMTPETDTTTHYFFASSRNYKMEDGDYNEAKMAGMLQAFLEEDKPVIEAQYREMGGDDFWALDPVLLSSDAGGLRVRRVLEKLIDQEQPASTPS
uniref:aromatic ring-hydroxylating dioxygenase subunit alpha n=1 Tax=Marinobacterium litorale TaxID=404770 RepID=UPI001B7FC641